VIYPIHRGQAITSFWLCSQRGLLSIALRKPHSYFAQPETIVAKF
jgi:hypothetical protein